VADMKKIYDATGNPIQKNPTVLDKFGMITKKARFLAIGLVAFVAALSGLLTNLDKVKKMIFPSQLTEQNYTAIADKLVEHFKTIGFPYSLVYPYEATDSEIIYYLEEIAEQAQLIADIWDKTHQQLVNAAFENEEEWDSLKKRVRLRPPPNMVSFSGYFIWLTQFYNLVKTLSDSEKPYQLSKIIIHSQSFLETRGQAVHSLKDLTDSVNGNKLEDREHKILELASIVERLTQEAAALKALSTIVKLRLYQENQKT
jgi:hypothetical protein